MLSDEERKAINQLKADTSFYDYELKNGNYIYELFKIEVYKKDIDVILNLIKKQSKEIEELKNSDLTTVYLNGFYDGENKVKDKIKAKIEELKAIADNGANAVRFAMTHEDEIERIQKQKDIGTMVEILQSLLERSRYYEILL